MSIVLMNSPILADDPVAQKWDKIHEREFGARVAACNTFAGRGGNATRYDTIAPHRRAEFERLWRSAFAVNDACIWLALREMRGRKA